MKKITSLLWMLLLPIMLVGCSSEQATATPTALLPPTAAATATSPGEAATVAPLATDTATVGSAATAPTDAATAISPAATATSAEATAPATTTSTATVGAAASTGDTTPKIVAAANAFLATLSATEKATTLFDWTNTAQKQRWSNFPPAGFQRAGLMWGNMSTEQQNAWLAVMQVTLSTEGYNRVRAE